jgi:hypothetical protein
MPPVCVRAGTPTQWHCALQALLAEMIYKSQDEPGVSWRVGLHPPIQVRPRPHHYNPFSPLYTMMFIARLHCYVHA